MHEIDGEAQMEKLLFPSGLLRRMLRRTLGGDTLYVPPRPIHSYGGYKEKSPCFSC